MSKPPRHPPVSLLRMTVGSGRAAVTGGRLLAVALVWSGRVAGACAAEIDPNDLPFNPPVHLDDSSMPDPARTPGDFMQKAKSKDLCDEDNDHRQSVPARAMCDRVFDDYGIPPEHRFQYRCGYLVPLTVGGANTQQNVWPQPAREAVFKQKLDVELQKQVCGEQVSPAQAQVDVAGDWVRAYRHYLMPSDPPPFIAEAQPTSDPIAKTPVSVQNGSPASVGAGGGSGSPGAGGMDVAPQVAPNDMRRRNRPNAQESEATNPNAHAPNPQGRGAQAQDGATRQRQAVGGAPHSYGAATPQRVAPGAARLSSGHPRRLRH